MDAYVHSGNDVFIVDLNDPVTAELLEYHLYYIEGGMRHYAIGGARAVEVAEGAEIPRSWDGEVIFPEATVSPAYFTTEILVEPVGEGFVARVGKFDGFGVSREDAVAVLDRKLCLLLGIDRDM